MQDKGAYFYGQFLSGDITALEELVKEYSDNLIRFAYLYVKDFNAAEDIAEDAIATLIFKRKKFKQEAKFKTYLFSIVKNKCKDFLRKKTRLSSLENWQNVLADAGFEDRFAKDETYKTLYTCLNLLPEYYREVLHLIYFEELKTEQICNILHKNTKQIYNLTARAKSSLKNLLIEKGINYEDL